MVLGSLLVLLLMRLMVPGIDMCVPNSGFSSKQVENPYIEYRQPNKPEEASGKIEDTASGKIERELTKDDKRLVRISSTQIEFKKKERDAKCRLASKQCKASLLTLADVVETHWSKKYKLRVISAYVERSDFRDFDKIFRNESLHLEGRAFDLQLIEPPHRLKRSVHKKRFTHRKRSLHRKRSINRRNVNHRRLSRTSKTQQQQQQQQQQRNIDKNLPELAGLAYYHADFSFVEVMRHHIHVSCTKSGKPKKSKSRWEVFSHRCFPETATVRHEDGRKVAMKDLRVGDRVLTLNDQHQPTFTEVSMMMDRQSNVTATDYVRITTQNNKTLTLSMNHLVPVLAPNSTQKEFIFSKDVRPHYHEVYVYDSNSSGHRGCSGSTESCVSKSAVASVELVERRGAYAPLTMEGTIVVDDVLASCYASFPDHWVSHYVFIVWRTLYTLLSQLVDLSLYQSLSDGVHWYPNFFRTALNVFPVLPYPL